ncbi:fibronectin type III domain-containing protein [Candidatus Pristimantibacillus sp. PTI5]|uniref:fibronectin type III domain-containing protein n=1 Tax=Candidatus Pristimantibacillus sp. PTI5 TaxID=3400422 RepID=UPI003B02827E
MKRLRLKVQYLLITGMLALLFVPLSSYAAEQSAVSESGLTEAINGMGITVTSPANGTIVGNQLYIGLKVSYTTFQIAKVTAQVDDVTMNFVSCGVNYTCWKGTMDISSLPKGEKSVLITAWDSKGNSVSKTIDIIYDEKPVLQVQQLATDFTGQTPKLRVQATCTDDDPNGCTLEISYGSEKITRVNSIDQHVDLGEYIDQGLDISLTAVDSRNQTASQSFSVWPEHSEWLRLVDTVDGDILDVSTEKILFDNRQKKQLGIKDRKSGEIITVPYDLPVNDVFKYGFLTPHGAVMALQLDKGIMDAPSVLYEWRDGKLDSLGYFHSSFACEQEYLLCSIHDVPVNQNYALYENSDLILRNLVTGTNEIIPSPPEELIMRFFLTGNEVYFATYGMSWENPGGSYKYDKGTITPLDHSTSETLLSSITDGHYTLFCKTNSYNSPCSLVLRGPDGDQAIGEVWSDVRGSDYQLNQGWVAYNRPTISGEQLWLRAPDGQEQQVANFRTSYPYIIAYLAENGDVAFYNDNKLFLRKYKADGISDPVEIGTSELRLVRLDGQEYGMIDNTLFALKKETTAPTIGSVQPLDGETVTVNNPVLSAVILDPDSGVDPFTLIVKVDDQILESSYDVESMTVTAPASGLQDGTHSLLIRAADKEGNIAEHSGSFTVKKSVWSVWPEGSSLKAENVGRNALALSWPAARESNGYRIYRNGELIDTVNGNVHSYDVTMLQPDTRYIFKVESELPDGNWSTDGPSMSVRTSSPFLEWLNKLHAAFVAGNPADIQDVRNLLDEIAGLDDSADQSLIDPLWNKISAKLPASVDQAELKISLFRIVKAIGSLRYDPQLSDLEAIRTNPEFIAALETIAAAGGHPNVSMDDFLILLFGDGRNAAGIEGTVRDILKNMKPKELAALLANKDRMNAVLSKALAEVLDDKNTYALSAVLYKLDVKPEDVRSAVYNFQVKLKHDVPAINALIVAFIRSEADETVKIIANGKKHEYGLKVLDIELPSIIVKWTKVSGSDDVTVNLNGNVSIPNHAASGTAVIQASLFNPYGGKAKVIFQKEVTLINAD